MVLLTSTVAGLDFSTLPQQLVNGVLIGSIYALIALGYTMVYGVLRLINFAHGEVFMLGAYTALFTSWGLGFTPEAMKAGQSPQASILNLVIMLLVSMTVCAIVGVAIEFFAYRPMRNQSRVAALITAIGVSLLLQYGGQLFFPNIQQNIQQSVIPFQGALEIPLVPVSKELKTELAAARVTEQDAQKKLDVFLKSGATEFNLPPDGQEAKKVRDDAKEKINELNTKINQTSSTLSIPYGKLTMLISAIGIMMLLWFVVMKTKVGRSMRAVSHDFDSASLMGVNVNWVITATFAIGSALAGAGAMMNATFEGTGISPFYGVQPGVKAFVAAVLGGIGNIRGAVLGGLLMGVAETMVVWAGFSNFKDAIAFVILIVVLLFKPSGLLGSAKVEKV